MTINKPFHDPKADTHGSVTEYFTVADTQFEFSDPFGEAPPTNNAVDQFIRWMNLAAITLQDYLNAAALSNVQPNAQITVYYNAYRAMNPSHDFGVEVPGMWVTNNSDTNLLLQNASIYGNPNEETMIFLNYQNVPAGGMTSVNINSPNFKAFEIRVLVVMRTSSGTPIVVKVNLLPFGCRK